MAFMDLFWKYDRVILPVVAFAVGAVVVQPGSGTDGTASVLESNSQQFEFEKAYQEEIADLTKSVDKLNKDISDKESESSNLTDIINQYSVDTDNDGIADYMEDILKTDPKRKDTDGDGYADLAEIQKGFSPIAVPSVAQKPAEVPKIPVTPEPVASEKKSVSIVDNPPAGGISGTECLIKGASDKTYYLPGRPDYDDIKDIAKWFCSIEQALGEGFHPPLK